MNNMTLELAKKIVSYAENLVINEFGNKPFSIAVCDKYGFSVLFQKIDGAKLLTISLTPAKAYTAAHFGVSTGTFLQRLQKENLEISYFADPKFVAMPGGEPICDVNNEVIGAVGIGGLPEDGIVAQKIAQHFAGI